MGEKGSSGEGVRTERDRFAERVRRGGQGGLESRASNKLNANRKSNQHHWATGCRAQNGQQLNLYIANKIWSLVKLNLSPWHLWLTNFWCKNAHTCCPSSAQQHTDGLRSMHHKAHASKWSKAALSSVIHATLPGVGLSGYEGKFCKPSHQGWQWPVSINPQERSKVMYPTVHVSKLSKSPTCHPSNPGELCVSAANDK